jgi:integrase
LKSSSGQPNPPRAGKDGVSDALPEGDSRRPEADGRKRASADQSREDVRRSTTPPLAACDLGGADWERDLIAALRERGLLWRTEETYQGWAVRFAAFLAPRSPYACDADDVGAFLSRLAVTQRASSSSQKQALNAIVFLVQQALKRQLGEIKFRRAKACRAVPTVLSRDECKRLFDQLTGTTRLMAELAYGAGLRLLELLRLRVHHLDLARQQLQIYDGKGAKHRLTVETAAPWTLQRSPSSLRDAPFTLLNSSPSLYSRSE